MATIALTLEKSRKRTNTVKEGYDGTKLKVVSLNISGPKESLNQESIKSTLFYAFMLLLAAISLSQFCGW